MSAYWVSRDPSRSPESHAACSPPPGEKRSPTTPTRNAPNLSSSGAASSLDLSSREYLQRCRCVHAGAPAQEPSLREATSSSSRPHSSFGCASLSMDHRAEAWKTTTGNGACVLFEDSLLMRRSAGSSSG